MNNLYNSVRSYLRVDTSLEKREYGFKDACSRLVELDETIVLPKSYKMQNINEQEPLCSDVAEFSGSISQSNNVIKFTQRLALKKRVYEAEDWADFRDAVLKHKSFSNYIILTK